MTRLPDAEIDEIIRRSESHEPLDGQLLNCPTARSLALELRERRAAEKEDLTPERVSAYLSGLEDFAFLEVLVASGESTSSAVIREFKARKAAEAKAAQYEADWVAAKYEFGTALGKAHETIRNREREHLEACAELDETRAELAQLRARVGELEGQLDFYRGGPPND